jgi:glycosyltransferase involved in cell wall biosynthesis
MKSDMPPITINPPKDVQILLATYNGARYLRQQLNSICDQTYQTWRLLVRDDGSTDGTLSILQDYAQRDSRITFVQDHETHLGACQSFAYLMQQSTAPYCMFCDQDDVWSPSKIHDMLSKMHLMERHVSVYTPLLIVSDLSVIDDKQAMIAPSFWKCQGLNPRTGSRFASLIIQNKFPGCSMLLNRSLIDLSQDIPEDAIMHDWWVAMTAAAFGRIIIMPEPYIYYRQHQSNTIGLAQTSTFKSLIRSIFKIITRDPIALSNLNALKDLNEIKACRAFQTKFAPRLSKHQTAILDSVINYSLLGVIRYRIFRQPLLSNINLFLVLILLKWNHIRSIHNPIGS